MTRVDFYLLQTESPQKLLDTTCVLIEKARAQRQSIYIHARDASHADELDSALWQFRSASFIPHLNLGSSRETGDQAPAPTTGHIPGIAESAATTHTFPGSMTPQVPLPRDAESSVAIGYQHEPTGSRDVLINFSEEVPHFFSRFRRTLEIVGASESQRQSSRTRYRFYQSRGYPLRHHNLG